MVLAVGGVGEGEVLEEGAPQVVASVEVEGEAGDSIAGRFMVSGFLLNRH